MINSLLKNWITSLCGLVVIGIGIWDYNNDDTTTLLELIQYIIAGMGLMGAKDGLRNSLTEEEQLKIRKLLKEREPIKNNVWGSEVSE